MDIDIYISIYLSIIMYKYDKTIYQWLEMLSGKYEVHGSVPPFELYI